MTLRKQTFTKTIRCTEQHKSYSTSALCVSDCVCHIPPIYIYIYILLSSINLFKLLIVCFCPWHISKMKTDHYHNSMYLKWSSDITQILNASQIHNIDD